MNQTAERGKVATMDRVRQREELRTILADLRISLARIEQLIQEAKR